MARDWSGSAQDHGAEMEKTSKTAKTATATAPICNCAEMSVSKCEARMRRMAENRRQARDAMTATESPQSRGWREGLSINDRPIASSWDCPNGRRPSLVAWLKTSGRQVEIAVLLPWGCWFAAAQRRVGFSLGVPGTAVACRGCLAAGRTPLKAKHEGPGDDRER